ncbi:hypothetical protein [Rhizobium sp. MHM7A]|uniref:hypothetical protein n=1 Tax=Rhizobium sp. MHM7A TaxID=2583233 RepID=UPI001105F7F9|nr:hypothetical protein [Rhizobium sp. MHM7A]TLX16896.1 hypothetical protein FFR93_05995 [Rhizobium sp. MHM7A]
MGFKKQQAAAAVAEDVDAGMEASIDREASSVEETPVATAEVASDTVVVANETVDELQKADEVKPEEENDPSASPTESLDDQLLAGGGMELSDDAIDPPAPAVDAVPAETGAAVENVDAVTEAPAADEVAPEGGKPRFEPLVGNGSALSQNAQRKAAQAEKDAARQGYGGGGGGGAIGALVSAPISGLKWALSGVGAGIMHAGGQKLADRFFQPGDPVSVAKRAFRHRYAAYDGAIKKMNASTAARDASIDQLNNLIVQSEAGRTLKQMAEARKVELHDLMSDVRSGKDRDPFALKCMERLERDPNFGPAAQNMVAAQKAFTDAEAIAQTNLARLTADHGADINPTFEANRLVGAIEKAETDAKKPLPLEVTAKNSETGAEEKIDTEKQHKKFMEALDKIKETIAALLHKIMSKLGIGGPK